MHDSGAGTAGLGDCDHQFCRVRLGCNRAAAPERGHRALQRCRHESSRRLGSVCDYRCAGFSNNDDNDHGRHDHTDNHDGAWFDQTHSRDWAPNWPLTPRDQTFPSECRIGSFPKFYAAHAALAALSTLCNGANQVVFNSVPTDGTVWDRQGADATLFVADNDAAPGEDGNPCNDRDGIMMIRANGRLAGGGGLAAVNKPVALDVTVTSSSGGWDDAVNGGSGSGAGTALTWTALRNVTVTSNVLKKTAGCDGCVDAGAVSVQSLPSGNGSSGETHLVVGAAGSLNESERRAQERLDQPAGLKLRRCPRPLRFHLARQ